MTIAFYILAAVALTGAILGVCLPNLVRAVYAVLLFFSALAGLFLLLLAEFIAVVQILIYIGSVGILVLFAIMLTQDVAAKDEKVIETRGSHWGVFATIALLVAILVPILGHIAVEPSALMQDYKPSVQDLGKVMMDPYIASVEVIALLLTAGLIGAVVIAGGEPSENGKQGSQKERGN